MLGTYVDDSPWASGPGIDHLVEELFKQFNVPPEAFHAFLEKLGGSAFGWAVGIFATTAPGLAFTNTAGVAPTTG